MRDAGYFLAFCAILIAVAGSILGITFAIGHLIDGALRAAVSGFI